MFLYYTSELVQWVGSIHYGDTEAMMAKSQARLEPPRKSWLCIYGLLHAGSGLRGVRGVGQLRVRSWQWITWGHGWWSSPR